MKIILFSAILLALLPRVLFSLTLLPATTNWPSKVNYKTPWKLQSSTINSQKLGFEMYSSFVIQNSIKNCTANSIVSIENTKSIKQICNLSGTGVCHFSVLPPKGIPTYVYTVVIKGTGLICDQTGLVTMTTHCINLGKNPSCGFARNAYPWLFTTKLLTY